MIDYDFYVNSYLGTSIPEKAFTTAAARAQDALTRLCRQYQVMNCDEISEQMALCAMAETIYSYKKDAVTSAAVGNVSVRYEKGKDLNRQLLEKARIYLDIYRGNSLCAP